jgi:hypothetical protein
MYTSAKKNYGFKYIWLALFIATAPGFSNNAAAQVNFSLGAKGGVTFTSFNGDDAADIKRRKGFAGGAFVNLSFLKVLSIQPEFLYHQKGATNTMNGTKDEIKINYFQIPVLIKFRVPLGETVYPHIFAGPSFAYRTSTEYNSTNMHNGKSVETDVDRIRTTDSGGIIGAGIDFEAGSIFFTLDGRYGFGARYLGDQSYNLSFRNRDITVMAGLGFRLGRNSR